MPHDPLITMATAKTAPTTSTKAPAKQQPAAPIPPTPQRPDGKALLRDMEVDEYQLMAQTLNPNQVSEEYARVSSDYAYFNEQYGIAVFTHAEAVAEAKAAWHSVFLACAGTPGASGKPLTKDERDSTAYTDPNYRTAQTAENQALAEMKRLWGVLDSIRSKKEMLISLGATQRQEYNGLDPMKGDDEPQF